MSSIVFARTHTHIYTQTNPNTLIETTQSMLTSNGMLCAKGLHLSIRPVRYIRVLAIKVLLKAWQAREIPLWLGHAMREVTSATTAAIPATSASIATTTIATTTIATAASTIRAWSIRERERERERVCVCVSE